MSSVDGVLLHRWRLEGEIPPKTRTCGGGGDGGCKRAIISQNRQENERAAMPLLLPVPCASEGAQGRSGECEVLWEEEQSPALSPRERPCSGPRGTRSQWFKCMNGWMDGRLSGWMLGGWPAHRAGMQGNQGKAGGMRGIIVEQSRGLSPRESSAPGLQGTRSQLLWMDTRMNE